MTAGGLLAYAAFASSRPARVAICCCYNPEHLVHSHIVAGRLKRLDIAEHRGRDFAFPLHVRQLRSRPPGRAGRWFIADLGRQLPIACPQMRQTHAKS